MIHCKSEDTIRASSCSQGVNVASTLIHIRVFSRCGWVSQSGTVAEQIGLFEIVAIGRFRGNESDVRAFLCWNEKLSSFGAHPLDNLPYQSHVWFEERSKYALPVEFPTFT